MAGDVGGVFGGQVGEEGGDFFGLGVAAQGDLAVDFFEHGIGVFGALHGCQDIAGRDGADSYLGGEFEGHGFCEFDDSCLGGVVIRIKRLPYEPIGRGGLQDHAAAALPHVTRGGLGHVEESGQVHRESAVPFIGSDVEELVADGDAGVIDEDVDPAHEVDGFRERSLDLRELRDVGGNDAGEFRELALDFGATFLVAVEDDDARAFFEEADSGGGADSAGASRDQHTFVR